MSAKEEQQIDTWMEELEALLEPYWQRNPPPTPIQLAQWGYQQSLQREEYHDTVVLDEEPGLTRLLQLPHNHPQVEEPSPSIQTLFYFGFGFFHGLKYTRQISARLHSRLLKRLQQEVIDQSAPPSVPKTQAHEDLLQEIFAPNEEPDRILLRQRATLVQQLRQQGTELWRTVRQALYEPHTLSPEERNALLEQARRSLTSEQIQTLQDIE